MPLPFGKCILQFGNVCSANKTGLVVLYTTLDFIVIDEMRENDSTLQIRISTCLRKARSCIDYKLVNLMTL